MRNQLTLEELEKVLTCISSEIHKLDLYYGAKAKKRQRLLYSARDKLLHQKEELKKW